MPLPDDVLLRHGRAPEPVDLRLRGGRVVQVAPALAPERGERVLDLGGRFVRHGLRDAHAHVVEWARSRRDVDLSRARTAAEAAALLAAAAGRPGVLRGASFRDALWPEPPTARLLQAVVPDRVVVARSLDMHSAWLSPRALALAGLPDHPTGLLQEHEAWQALERLPVPTEEEDDASVADAVAAAHARGLTAVVDFSFEDPLAAWSRRALAAPLPLRVTCVVQRHRLPAAADRGLRTGDGDDRLRVGPVKLFADGALGARTARCLTPYADGRGHGEQLLDPDALRLAVHEARAAGFTVAVHAIGDEATRDALRVLAEEPVPGASLEHAQLLRREDLPLFRAARVVASVQPAHLLDDRDLVDDLWRDTASLPYAGRSLLEAGATLALGSDAPVAPLDPWLAVAAAVHRTDGGREPWRPEEALPLEVALAAAGGRRLQEGDRADVVVLDAADPVALSAADLARVPVHLTLLDGQPVHDPSGATA